VAQRNNHYDSALEEYLRRQRVPYVAVDEARRALDADVSIKSLDFIVYSQQGPNLLIDVKGRQFPSGAKSRRCWENWSTADDIESLDRWQEVFGPDFRSALIFAYNVVDEAYLDQFPGHFAHRDRRYAFVGITLEDYRRHMRVRSSSWGTVSLPGRAFRALVCPLEEML
jgi:hypothetical protein